MNQSTVVLGTAEIQNKIETWVHPACKNVGLVSTQ